MGEINQARAYGVAVLPTMLPAGAEYWKVVEIRHLGPLENRGRHHVFVDVVDGAGQRVRDQSLRIGWTWAGRRDNEPAPPQALDKGDGEPMGNVDLYRGAHVRIWIMGGGLSTEAVENLSTDHPDEPTPGSNEKFNTVGHHSFYVRFQWAVAPGVELPSEPPIEPDGNEAALAVIRRLQADVTALRAWQREVTQFMQRMIGDL